MYFNYIQLIRIFIAYHIYEVFTIFLTYKGGRKNRR
nr:MAG TPA: hypothetical protein [Caudoviricetes sp.]